MAGGVVTILQNIDGTPRAFGYWSHNGQKGGNLSPTSGPASSAAAVTPHAANPLNKVSKALYVGFSGTLVCRLADDEDDTTFHNVQAGQILPIQVSHVRISTAGAIVALY